MFQKLDSHKLSSNLVDQVSSSIVFKSFVMVKRFNVKSLEWKLERQDWQDRLV